MKKLFCVVLSVVMLVSLTACSKGGSGEEKSMTLTCGGIQSAEDKATLAMNKFADLVKEKTGGTITIQVSPASQLGDATSQIEAVSLGTQEMFVDAASFISTFVNDKQVESMFFTFRDEDHYRAYLKSEISSKMEETFRTTKGVRILANNWLRVPRSIASATPINSLEDLNGLKMRVPDIKAYLESASALGCGATQVAWGETYLALQQGVVNACESPMDSMYTMKFYEPTKCISVTEHIRDNLAVFINDSIYDGMSEKQKTAITEAANEAGDWYTEEVKKAAEEYRNIMESEGTQFIETDVTAMREVIAAKAIELEESGFWSKGLYEEIQAIK